MAITTTPSDPLFIFSDGTPVAPHNVRKVLKLMLRSINLNPRLYDTHSFRKGRATDLFKAGYLVDQIKAMGCWRSNAIYKYLDI